jgi:hypothetical protein
VTALFTIGSRGPSEEELVNDAPAVAALDRSSILERISNLEREIAELKALLGSR